MASDDDGKGWVSLGLDTRLIEALVKMQYCSPTPVQSRATPLVLAGKDVVALSHTGSGKTAAYLIPAIHKIMQHTGVLLNPRVLILVPTLELAHQVKKEASSLLSKCAPTLRAGELPADGCTSAFLREFFGAPPEILISTPSRAADSIRGRFFPPGALHANLELFVLDEADLLMSFGYEDDIRCVVDAVDRGCQCMLLSATSSSVFSDLQALVLHNPVHLDISEEERLDISENCVDKVACAVEMNPKISHFSVTVKDVDKMLYCMAFFRLGLCKMKALVFVSSADVAVQLRLFLCSFGISCCVLHAELPVNSRVHILQEFNRGVYDYMIAAVEESALHIHSQVMKERRQTNEMVKDTFRHSFEQSSEKGANIQNNKHAYRLSSEIDYGVVRGIDFKRVQTVINFDVPLTATSYLHRVGRTGRAGSRGTAITLVSPYQQVALESLQKDLSMFCDGKLDTTSVAIMPYDRLETDRIEALRYRAEDVFRTVGRHAVREARIRELRGELLNSERLAAHFEDNPEDLNLLRHDGSLARLASSQHLRHLPAYLRHGSTGKQASCKEGVFGKIRSCLNEKNGVPLADLEEPSEFWQRKRKRRDGKMNNPRERMDALRSNGPSQAKNIFKNRRKKKGQHRSTN